jgi:hypothetical protein
MGELQKKYQVAFWSIPEVRRVLDSLKSEAQHELLLTFRDDILKQQTLLNALILYIGDLPDPIRQEALRYGLARLEALLAEPPSSPPQTINAHGEGPPPPPPPPVRRKKRG